MDNDNVLQYDNGIIAMALMVYAKIAVEEGAPSDLIDRANELYFIFTNKSTTEKYEFPESTAQ